MDGSTQPAIAFEPIAPAAGREFVEPIRTILIGIDYSENSANALRESARIADSNGAKLVCLHVVEEAAEVAASAADGLREFVRGRIGDRLGTELRVPVGRPFSEVVAAIEFTRPDLLVLGSNGQAGDDPGHVGELASRCVRRLQVDVLLVQARQQQAFSGIVACVDFSENAVVAASRAAQLAEQDGARLELLHVMPEGSQLSPAVIQEQLDRIRDELVASYDCVGIRAQIVAARTPVEGIVQRVVALDADLLTLGSTGSGGAGRRQAELGTTAERLIYRVPCSALVVR